MRAAGSDTIAAISSAPGEGGIGVIRVSGAAALEIAQKIFQSKNGQRVCDQKSWTVRLGRVVDCVSSRLVDEALLLVMRAPKSYTREDVVEIMVHGGPSVVSGVLKAAVDAGARLAEPGEFTKRAFLNGRLDLVQAEAVLDLVRSRTDLASRWAASQLGGRLSDLLAAIKSDLFSALTSLEAMIDFPEDMDESRERKSSAAKTSQALSQVKRLLEEADWGILARRGMRFVIAGRPNVGKSSLLNGLARVNRVIVTPYPGTTRDVIEEEIQIGGFPVRLADTAGIQNSSDPIEREGIERSRRMIEGADAVLFVLDGSMPGTEEDQVLYRSIRGKPVIVIVNKSDLPQKLSLHNFLEAPEDSIVRSSCFSQGGLRELEEKIFRTLTSGKVEVPDEVFITSIRQKMVLEKVESALVRAVDALKGDVPEDLVAVEIRAALDELGQLTGDVIADEVLDAIFAQFCIGK